MNCMQISHFCDRLAQLNEQSEAQIMAQLGARRPLPPGFKLDHLRILEVYAEKPRTLAKEYTLPRVRRRMTKGRVNYLLRAQLMESHGTAANWKDRWYYLTELGAAVVKDARKARATAVRLVMKTLATREGYAPLVKTIWDFKMGSPTKVDELSQGEVPAETRKVGGADYGSKRRALIKRQAVPSNAKGGRYTPDPKLPESKKPADPYAWKK